MVKAAVKGKLWKKQHILLALALITFTLSWAGTFPQGFVEKWFSRTVYPDISTAARMFADAARFAWLDVIIPIGLTLLLVAVHRRKFYLLANIVAVLYLIFFWSWGLNYHRQPLASKIPFDEARTYNAGIEEFARKTAEHINRLYSEKQRQTTDDTRVREQAVERVRRVASVIDGASWHGPSRIKNSFFANPWFHAAGIDGVFNLFAQEPLVTNSLLDFEKPFVMTHELAHVYGYAGEGDANLIAVFATIMSADPHFQYSGWMNLWLYVRSRKLDDLLEAGPRQDFERMIQRMRSEQIQWVTAVQGTILDWYLKSNSVHEGIRSYSQVVLLAAGTEPYWDRFR